MAIIKFTKNSTPDTFSALQMYPDQFVSQKTKESNDWIKISMDYFYSVALRQFTSNKKIEKKYRRYKGELTREDFGEAPNELKSLVESYIDQENLPAYVKEYSILTPPINTLKGELNKKPDNVFVKAFDSESQSEELQFKTDILNQLITQKVKETLQTKFAQEGIEIDDEEEFNKMTAEKAQKFITSYTSQAEKWGSRVLEYLKMRFSMKEKSEEAFGDLLIAAREFFHIYEDNSEVGFNIEVLNPKNVWYLMTQDQAYTSNPLDKNEGAYAAGHIEIMELSEIINKFKLTKDEIEHLKSISQQSYLINSRESNLVSPGKTGINSVEYDNYDPLVLEYRLAMESELSGNKDELNDLLGVSSSVAIFGNKFLVIKAYWCSKKKMGKLVYIDVDGMEQTTMVDENYKDGMHPKEISIEWGWINQWYEGVKIGLDIYYCKPLERLDYCPIIGQIFEPKNLKEPVSLLDQMVNFDMMYNIMVNDLFRLIQKDMGVVLIQSIRHIPVPKDGDYQDALETWEMEAREKGIVFIDDSPENTKGPSSFNQFSRQDLSRATEMQARLNMAIQIRNECWKLVGLSEQRLGESKATETATGINNSLTQSYAQTDTWFTKHSNLINKVYQALLDSALYMCANGISEKLSNLSYITDEGEDTFAKINGSDLKLKELGVFVTDRAEDARAFQELRSLGQAMMQNGASPYEISILYSTKSMRNMQDIFKKLKDKQDQFQQQQQQIEQQKVEQQQMQFEKAQELATIQDDKNKAFEAYENEKDRIAKERVAYIQANTSLIGGSTQPTDLDMSRFEHEKQDAYNAYSIKVQELAQKQMAITSQQNIASQDIQLKKDALQVKREDIAAKERIAKQNKNKFDSKPKKK